MPAFLARSAVDWARIWERCGPWDGAGIIRCRRCWRTDTSIRGWPSVAGDAAHGIHPIAGQGLNLGFRDAIALADLVIEARTAGRDVGSPELLARYQRARLGDNLAMLAMTDGLDRLFSTNNPALRLQRAIWGLPPSIGLGR